MLPPPRPGPVREPVTIPIAAESRKGQWAQSKRHVVAWPTSVWSQLRREKQQLIHLLRQVWLPWQRLETAAAQYGSCAEHRLLHFLPQFFPASTRPGEAIAPTAAAPRAKRDARRETVATARRANASKRVPFIDFSWGREARNDDQRRQWRRRHPIAHGSHVQSARCRRSRRSQTRVCRT
jgi:hypothetical protein